MPKADSPVPSTSPNPDPDPRTRSAGSRVWSAAILGLAAALLGLGLLPERAPSEASAQQQGLQHAYRLVDTWEGSSQQSAAGAVLFPAGLDATESLIWVVDAGNHRIEAFDWDGALHRVFGRLGDGPDQLRDPRDIAVDGSRVYVLDRGNRRVSIFDLEGRPIERWEDLQLDSPWGIAAGGGRVYVSEPERGQVVVARDGQVEARWSVDGQPRGLDLGPDGLLRVTRPALGLVSSYRPDGGLDAEIAQPNQELAPWDVSVDEDGGLYVQSARAILWYPAGEVVSRQAMYRDGLAGLTHWPRKGVVATVVDEQRTWHGLIAFDWKPADGERIWDRPYLGFPQGRFHEPRAVHAGADGQIYVLDAWPRVQAFDTRGQPSLQRVPGLAPTRLFEPVDLTATAAGALYVVEPRHLTQLAPDGAVLASLRLRRGNTEQWGTAIGLHDAGRRVGLLDSAGSQMLDYGITQTLRPIGGFALETPGEGWSLWWDLVALHGPSGERIYAAARGDRRIAVFEDGQAAGGWSVEGIPIRMAAGPEDQLFVLFKGGLVQEYAADGRLLAEWDAASVAAGASEVVDLTVDDAGRVYTVDRAAGNLRIWARDPDAEPEPAPRRGDGCSLRGDKRAAPASLVLGQTVTVTLSLGGDCPSAGSGADIILAVDKSYSMQADGKITDTIAAALSFVDGIDFGQDRLAVVAFDNTASLAQGLTADEAAIRSAITGLVPLGATNIAAAMNLAVDELTGPRGRAEADRVIVLLTDGKDDEPAAVLDAARRAKRSAGARVFTIGFGQVDPMVMVRSASSPEDNYYAPDSSTLDQIYGEIARRLSATVLARRMQIQDEIPANMRYVGPVSGPAPSRAGQILTWDLVDLPFGGIDLSYALEPQQLGRHPTNVEATADFTDGLDETGSLRFPVPEVEVLSLPPTPTLTPTPFPTPTPRPPSTDTPPPPEPIFLPLVLWQRCLDREILADVVLVTDTSGSMALPAAGEEGPTRLEAAVEAAGRFVTGLLEDQDGNRVALVSFDEQSRLVQGLTGDLAAVRQALAGLETFQGTRIDLGIAEALDELTGERSAPDHNRVMVLLTDGRVADESIEAASIDAAARAKDAGILVLAIGLGNEQDVDFELLSAVASRPDLVFQAPTAAELEAIYSQIAYTIECPNLDWP